MVWTKLADYDAKRDIILSIQNAALVPLSKVYFCLTESASPTPDNTFVLTGPNQWTGRVSTGTNVFIAEEDGGIATHCFSYIEKLVNYNIPTEQHDVELTQDLDIACPEGSYLTLQNKSKLPIYYTLDGPNAKAGKFVLTEHQMVSYTWAHDQGVKVFAAPGLDAQHGLISYAIGQSPNVTMLSEETQNMLEEMMAKVDMVIKNSATKDELLVVHKRTYLGFWSDFLSVTAQNSKNIPLPKFFSDEYYNSGFVEDDKIVEFTLSLNLNVTDKQTGKASDEVGTMSIILISKAAGDGYGVANFYTDNTWMQLNISEVELQRDATHKALFLTLKFKDAPNTATVSYAVRSDNCRFIEYTNPDFLAEKVAAYIIDKDNTEIHFTDDVFYNSMLSLFKYAISPVILTYGVTGFSETNGGNSFVVPADNSAGFEIHIADTGTEAEAVVKVNSAEGAGRIVGVNFVTKDKLNPNNLYFDLITMGNGDQIKTSQGGVDTFQIPLWNHSILNFSYITAPIKSTLTPENVTKYNMEIIYG